jgi:hypothetical protein
MAIRLDARDVQRRMFHAIICLLVVVADARLSHSL